MAFQLSISGMEVLRKLQRNSAGSSEGARVTCIHHNKKLNEWASGTKIRQIFLPPYLPNLNLIEKLWKFLRKKVINTGFYRTKDGFRQSVKDFFDNIGKYKEELEVLLTLKFRLCNSQTIPF